MVLPKSPELADMVQSVKADQLAHDALGVRRRRCTNVALILSLILGLLAVGLQSWLSKGAVAGFGLAAGLVSLVAALALLMLKPGEHLRVAGEYEALYLAAMQIDEGRPEAARPVQECQKAFDRIAQQTTTLGVRLTDGQKKKFERKAREALQQDDIRPDAKAALTRNSPVPRETRRVFSHGRSSCDDRLHNLLCRSPGGSGKINTAITRTRRDYTVDGGTTATMTAQALREL